MKEYFSKGEKDWVVLYLFAGIIGLVAILFFGAICKS